jgi:hypothetical protein
VPELVARRRAPATQQRFTIYQCRACVRACVRAGMYQV